MTGWKEETDEYAEPKPSDLPARHEEFFAEEQRYPFFIRWLDDVDEFFQDNPKRVVLVLLALLVCLMVIIQLR